MARGGDEGGWGNGGVRMKRDKNKCASLKAESLSDRLRYCVTMLYMHDLLSGSEHFQKCLKIRRQQTNTNKKGKVK